MAIKTYDKSKLKDKNRKMNVKNEIEILKRLNHPYIISLKETIETTT